MATPPDSGMNHLGFRCVTTPALWEAHREAARGKAPSDAPGKDAD
jgi:hypothetical protein